MIESEHQTLFIKNNIYSISNVARDVIVVKTLACVTTCVPAGLLSSPTRIFTPVSPVLLSPFQPSSWSTKEKYEWK